MSQRKGNHYKFTAEVGERILASIRMGGFIEPSAAAAGVSKQTLYTWMKVGARLNAKKKSRDRPLAKFSRDLAQAEAEGEVLANSKMYQHSQRNWQALAWRMARRWPERWAGKTSIELAGADGAPPIRTEVEMVDPRKMTSEQRQRRLAELEKKMAATTAGSLEGQRPQAESLDPVEDDR